MAICELPYSLPVIARSSQLDDKLVRGAAWAGQQEWALVPVVDRKEPAYVRLKRQGD